jgi:hypothetical protein
MYRLHDYTGIVKLFRDGPVFRPDQRPNVSAPRITLNIFQPANMSIDRYHHGRSDPFQNALCLLRREYLDLPMFTVRFADFSEHSHYRASLCVIVTEKTARQRGAA